MPIPSRCARLQSTGNRSLTRCLVSGAPLFSGCCMSEEQPMDGHRATYSPTMPPAADAIATGSCRTKPSVMPDRREPVQTAFGFAVSSWDATATQL